MKLNHLSLSVPDVAVTSRFFEHYFGFQCIDIKGDHIIAVLKNGDGFTLVLTNAKNAAITYPEDFHFGYMLETPGEV